MGQNHSQQHRLPFESRGQVVQELIASEDKYVLILKKIQSYYQTPLEKSKGILPDKKKVETIFSNSSQLLELHTEFLKALNAEKERELEDNERVPLKRRNSLMESISKTRKNIAKKVKDEEEDAEVAGVTEESIELEKLAEKRFARVFLEGLGADFEKHYYRYVSNYSAALKELIKCESKSKFRKFSRKAAKKAGCPLTAFLVLPVLRVGEYSYLFDSLAALTQDNHPDYADTKDAQELVALIAEKINDERRKAENVNNIFQIQFSFVDRLNLIADHRILIKEGEIIWLRKKSGLVGGGSTEVPVHFYLFNDIVIFAKHVTTVKRVLTKFSFQKTNYKVLKYFPLSKTRLVALPGSSTTHNQLELTCGEESYTLQVHSKEEQRNYVNIFYKTSVEADLFKDVWPRSSLNIIKGKKSKNDKEDDAVSSQAKEEQKTDDEYEETEYEESEYGGSDNDEEFEELWSDDEFFDEEASRKKKMNPKQRVKAHIEKALSALEYDETNPSMKRKLSKSSHHLPNGKRPMTKSLGPPKRSPRNEEEEDSDEERATRSKRSLSKRNLHDEDEEEEEEEEDEGFDGVDLRGNGNATSTKRKQSSEEKGHQFARATQKQQRPQHHRRKHSEDEDEEDDDDDDDSHIVKLPAEGGCNACLVM